MGRDGSVTVIHLAPMTCAITIFIGHAFLLQQYKRIFVRITLSPCAVNSLSSSGCLDHPYPLFPVCRHISKRCDDRQETMDGSARVIPVSSCSSMSSSIHFLLGRPLLLLPSLCASIIPF